MTRNRVSLSDTQRGLRGQCATFGARPIQRWRCGGRYSHADTWAHMQYHRKRVAAGRHISLRGQRLCTADKSGRYGL